jgi:hypothetical protein
VNSKKSTQCAIQCDLQTVRDVLDEQELAENLMEQWVDIDKEELVCDTLTDENIVESIINEKGTEGSDAEIEEAEEEPIEVLTAQEALNGLDTVIGWLEAQQEVEQVKIMQLVLLKNMILQKRFSCTKQQKITDFLKNYYIFFMLTYCSMLLVEINEF